MKVIGLMTLLSISLLAVLARADSIDDAEAKRRGVPVAQIQAENALVTEKRKEATLAAQIEEAKKQLAATTAKSPSKTEPGKPPSSAAAALYDEFVSRYMTGDWEKFAEDMAAREKELAALPPNQIADLAYMKETMADCTPGWWKGVKGGTTTDFQQVVWKVPVHVKYQPEATPKLLNFSTAERGLTFVLGWPRGDMDSNTPCPLAEFGEDHALNFGINKGHDLNAAIWSLLADAALLTEAGPEKIQTLPPDQRKQYDTYASFRKELTTAYYGTPPVRWLMFFRSYMAGGPNFDSMPEKLGMQPLISALTLDVSLHLANYPRFAQDAPFGLEKMGNSRVQENALTYYVGNFVLGRKFSLDQDRRLRTLIKALADSNTDWHNSKISLDNNLFYDLNIDADLPLAAARVKTILNHKAPAK